MKTGFSINSGRFQVHRYIEILRREHLRNFQVKRSVLVIFNGDTWQGSCQFRFVEVRSHEPNVVLLSVDYCIFQFVFQRLKINSSLNQRSRWRKCYANHCFANDFPNLENLEIRDDQCYSIREFQQKLGVICSIL